MRGRWRDFPLAIRMIAWRLVIPALKTSTPLPRLVRLLHRPPTANVSAQTRSARIVSLSERLCRGRFHKGTCLERSLLAYRFLSEAGAEPNLIVAVRRDGDVLEWHAWITCAGRPVHEDEASLRGYLPVVVFNAQGSVEWTRSGLPAFTDARL
jgi:hypothetical protein